MQFFRYFVVLSRYCSRSFSLVSCVSVVSKKELCGTYEAEPRISMSFSNTPCSEACVRFGFSPFLLSSEPFLSLLESVCASAPLVLASEVAAVPFAPPCFFARSFLRAISSIRTWRSSCSLIRFACRHSPSCFAIFAFISARSMSQALRARSWLCHSICRKRMTPIPAS